MTNNYDTLQKQVESESKNGMGFRDLVDTIEIYDKNNSDILVVPFNSLINRYRYFLERYIEEIELDEVEYQKFRKNPQALSEYLYGTIQFWNILLELNNCISRIDFDMKKIKIYNQNRMIEMINEIQIKKDQELSININ